MTFNFCRIFLRVELLSDILTADGHAIRQEIWKGIHNSSISRNGSHVWPSQPRPTEKAWNVWRLFLQRILHTNSSGRLEIPQQRIGLVVDWTWAYHESTNRLYHWAHEHILEYSLFRESRNHRIRQQQFRILGSVQDIPLGSVAVTVYHRGPSVLIDGIGMGDRRVLAKLAPIQRNINDYMVYQQVGTDDFLKTALIANKLMIMSDGSAKDGLGAAAWIVTSEELFTAGKFIKGSVKLPQCKADSYRAECFGLYGGLWTLSQLMQQLSLDKSNWGDIQIQCGCDNISALQRSFDLTRFPTIASSDSDFDIIGAIRSLLLSLPPIKWRHVKGHQQGPDLDIWGLLNNFADHEAGVTREDMTLEIPPADTLLLGEKWQILLGSTKLYKNIQSSIYDEISRSVVVPYWIKKIGSRKRGRLR